MSEPHRGERQSVCSVSGRSSGKGGKFIPDKSQTRNWENSRDNDSRILGRGTVLILACLFVSRILQDYKISVKERL